MVREEGCRFNFLGETLSSSIASPQLKLKMGDCKPDKILGSGRLRKPVIDKHPIQRK